MEEFLFLITCSNKEEKIVLQVLVYVSICPRTFGITTAFFISFCTLPSSFLSIRQAAVVLLRCVQGRAEFI